MGVFRRFSGSTNSNTIIGIILLIFLLVVISPNVLPSVLSRTFTFIDTGVPCERLRTALDRSRHQSLIGRQAENPLVLEVDASPLPNPNNPGESLVIRVTIINNTIGTVPFVYNPDQVIFGNNGSSGLGVIFEPNITLPGPTRQNQGVTSFPASEIRLLGPRQRCVHRIEIPASAAAPLGTGNATVRAFYNISTSGQAIPTDPTRPVIFSDQGLSPGPGGYFVESPRVVIPLPIQSN